MIDSFRGRYRFLSNFYPAVVSLDKRLGKGKGSANWKESSLDVMLMLLRQKFQEPKLRELLLETGVVYLVEGNDWHDTFYGRCNGNCHKGPHAPTGDNHLGRLLEQVRHELYAETQG